MSPKLTISDYSEKAFVVRGLTDTAIYANKFREMHGKYNIKLTGGPGWIFSKKRLQDVRKFVANVNNTISESSSEEESTSSTRSTGGVATLRNRYETKICQQFKNEIDQLRDDVTDITNTLPLFQHKTRETRETREKSSNTCGKSMVVLLFSFARSFYCYVSQQSYLS